MTGVLEGGVNVGKQSKFIFLLLLARILCAATRYKQTPCARTAVGTFVAIKGPVSPHNRT